MDDLVVLLFEELRELREKVRVVSEMIRLKGFDPEATTGPPKEVSEITAKRKATWKGKMPLSTAVKGLLASEGPLGIDGISRGIVTKFGVQSTTDDPKRGLYQILRYLRQKGLLRHDTDTGKYELTEKGKKKVKSQ